MDDSNTMQFVNIKNNLPIWKGNSVKRNISNYCVIKTNWQRYTKSSNSELRWLTLLLQICFRDNEIIVENVVNVAVIQFKKIFGFVDINMFCKNYNQIHETNEIKCTSIILRPTWHGNIASWDPLFYVPRTFFKCLYFVTESFLRSLIFWADFLISPWTFLLNIMFWNTSKSN